MDAKRTLTHATLDAYNPGTEVSLSARGSQLLNGKQLLFTPVATWPTSQHVSNLHFWGENELPET